MDGIVGRMALGFGVAVASVLVVHQGMWGLLHLFAVPGMTMPVPYPMDGVPPFGVPRIVSLAFWGGVWGAAFAAVWRGRWWTGGLLLGFAAILTGYFIIAPIKGLPVGGGFVLTNWARSILLNVSWGLATAWLFSRVSSAVAIPADVEYR